MKRLTFVVLAIACFAGCVGPTTKNGATTATRCTKSVTTTSSDGECRDMNAGTTTLAP